MKRNIITMDDIFSTQREEAERKKSAETPENPELARLNELLKMLDKGMYIHDFRELKTLYRKYNHIKLTTNKILEIKFSNRCK
jgi:hypothetical protein